MEWNIAYEMAATAVTLNDLENHSQVAGVFICNPSSFYTNIRYDTIRTFVQDFTRFQLTVCSRSLCVS